MPGPSPFPASQSQPPFPALYLYPINESFSRKHIALSNNQHVKIGRQTNAKTAPGERNGYFDSKVLSRQHAEVWEDGGKIFIKDVKSSNGTFINGERLSQEGVESEQFELKSDDIVEFGIDIVGEDNKTIIHHKVAARVVCVFNEQDVQVAARTEHLQQQQQQPQQQPQQYHTQGANAPLHAGQPGANTNGAFNFPGAPQQRRTQLVQQGLTGMGGMGGNIRPPGKSGLSFDLIFSRLQGELQKSKDTGAELHNLTTSLGEIQDTLGGSLPQNMPPPPHSLPPVRPPQAQQPLGGEQQPSSSAVVAATHNGPPPDGGSGHPPPTTPPETLLEMQVQLQDTQSSLASHVDKIRSLESMLAEQEAFNQEMRALRDLVKARELDFFHVAEREKDTSRRPSSNFEDDEDSEDDDAKSVMTVMAGEDGLERIDEEDEERMEHRDITEEIPEHELETDEEKHRRREELGRPKTPEPTIGIDMHVQSSSSSKRSGSPSSHKDLPILPVANDMSEQMSAMSEQVKAVMAVKLSLEAQHMAAQATIQALEKKVESLEALVKVTQEQQTTTVSSSSPPPTIPILVTPPPSVETAGEKEAEASLTEILSEWKKSVQGQWSSVQEEWSQERERLNRAREEFEAKTRAVDVGLEKVANLEMNMGTVKELQTNQSQQLSVLQTLVTRIQHQAQESGGSTSWFREHAGGVVNGEAIKHGLNGGLVTPPSPPRSRSSDSVRYRRRRKRAGKKKEREGSGGEDEAEEPVEATASKSRSLSRERGVGGVDTDTDATLASEDSGHSPITGDKKLAALLMTKRVSGGASSVVKEETAEDEEVRLRLNMMMRAHHHHLHHPEKSLVTPDPSVGDRLSMSFGSVSSGSGLDDEGDGEGEGESELGEGTLDSSKGRPVPSHLPYVNAQAAFGVLILSIAAAAVIWRVKPE